MTALLLAIAVVPIAYGRLAPPRDECSDVAALLDGQDIDPLTRTTTEGRRRTSLEARRFSGSIEPRDASQVPLLVAIQRTFGLPHRLLSPPAILPGRREPDDVRLETFESDHGEIPVHYAYERRGRAVRVTAYIMAHRGKAIWSPLRTRLAHGASALVHGRWPITLFAVSARVHEGQLRPNLERIDTWLNDAWSHYQRVCGPGAATPGTTSDSEPL